MRQTKRLTNFKGPGKGPILFQAITPKSSKAKIERFFQSSKIHAFKEQMCDLGSRMWAREYVEGNAGNIAFKVAEDLVLCTPTLVSKGFMKPADICLVDLEGQQLAGTKKRTSEIFLHMEIMKRQPRAVATVHCHPPHSTAFGLAGIELPRGLVSEFELFVSATIAPYRTPGTLALGKVAADLVDKHNTILLAHHGAISWSHASMEDAYFKIEILEAYCRVLIAAWQLNKPLQTLTAPQLHDLLKIKRNLGIPDPRYKTLSKTH